MRPLPSLWSSGPALLALPLLAACAHAPPPAVRTGPPPAAEALLARLDAQDRAVAAAAALRSSARIDYAGEGQHVKLKMTFVSRAPAALRVLAESSFVGTVASLATDGARFELLDTRDNRYLEGAAAPCNIARLLRVELSPADLVSVLGGSAPRPVHAVRSEGGWSGEAGGAEVLTLVGEDGARQILELSVAGGGLDLRAAELHASDGSLRWRVDHEEWSEVAPGLRLPARTRVRQWLPGAQGDKAAPRVDARLRFTSREPGAAVPDSVFTIDPPAGIPVEHVVCAD